MKAVTQEEPMGCGVACAAFLLKTPYQKARSMFKRPEHSSTRGFYCGEIASVLNKGGLKYSFSKVRPENKKLINKVGVIVFIEGSKTYPKGHFLVKAKGGWMNSWINHPSIAPAKSGFQKTLPGKAGWIIYPKGQF